MNVMVFALLTMVSAQAQIFPQCGEFGYKPVELYGTGSAHDLQQARAIRKAYIDCWDADFVVDSPPTCDDSNCDGDETCAPVGVEYHWDPFIFDLLDDYEHSCIYLGGGLGYMCEAECWLSRDMSWKCSDCASCEEEEEEEERLPQPWW